MYAIKIVDRFYSVRIFQLRTLTQRAMEVNKKVYTCYVDYKKAFDQVKHDSLIEVMNRAGIPELEQRLIIGLYWNQYATIKTADGKSRRICVSREVRQGSSSHQFYSICILSSLYAEGCTRRRNRWSYS